MVATADDTPSDAPDDRFVIPHPRDAAYSQLAARDGQSQVEDELQDLARRIDELRPRLERLEELHRTHTLWRRTAPERKELLKRIDEAERTRARYDREVEQLDASAEAHANRARDHRRAATQADHEAVVHRTRAGRAREQFEEHERHETDWKREQLAHADRAELAIRDAEAALAERDRPNDQARAEAGEAGAAAREAAGFETEADAVSPVAGPGSVYRDLATLRDGFNAERKSLEALEGGRVDRLRGEKDGLDKQLVRAEQKYGADHHQFDRERVRALLEQSLVEDGARRAATTLDAARAALTDAEVEERHTRHQFEQEQRRFAEIFGTGDADDLCDTDDLDALRRNAQVGAETREREARRHEQDAEAASSTAAAAEATAGTFRNRAREITGHLPDGFGTPGRVAQVPDDQALDDAVDTLVRTLRDGNRTLADAEQALLDRHEEERGFATSDGFRVLKGESQVASNLAANSARDAADAAEQTARLIDDRLATIDHDLARLDHDLATCTGELDMLLRRALGILGRMVRDGRIPDGVPRFGGQSVFRIGTDLSRLASDRRRDILEQYVTDLAESKRVPDTGQNLAAELVDRLRVARGISRLGIRILKPKGENETE
ncbi:MAG: hypothetical protein OXE86_20800 [Alphaproteobacteria bacterium]|nr:hypothetical protein [Alphaproteobacteria bacterium]